MENNTFVSERNKEICSCHCHFTSSLFCHIDCCCCPLICCNYESNPNSISNSYKALESPRFLIPKKEKEFFIKSETRSKKINFRNRNNIIPQKKSKSSTNTFDIEMNNDKIISNNDDDNQSKKDEDNKMKLIFEKIKVNRNKKERILTIQNNKNLRRKKALDINNFYPNSVQRNKNAKNINDIEFDNNKKIQVNKKLNITNINQNKKYPGKIFNLPLDNKFSIEDKNDDIINMKLNHYSLDINDNKMILQNLKKEIDKTKYMIGNLKTENKKLKNKLNQKERDDLTIEYKNINNNVIKHNNNEKNLEMNIIDLKKEIIEIKNKLKEYEGTIEILKNKNKEQEMIIENKNKEILNLIIKIGNFEKSIQNNENIHEKLNKSNENYKNSNDNLKSEILKLNKTIEDKNEQIKELQIKLKFANNFDNRKQKILEILFNFYKKLKKVINYEQSKELLQDIIDIMTVDDFKIKVDKVEKRIIQIIEDIQIKYGHCFACDIACCTSHVDKLKKFRNKIPKKK